MGERSLLSLLRGHRMKMLLLRMLDEAEFLSPHGVRSLSARIWREPFSVRHGRAHLQHRLRAGGEPHGQLFGGNSNWRGPVWMPVNMLLIEALRRFHSYYGAGFHGGVPGGIGPDAEPGRGRGRVSARAAGRGCSCAGRTACVPQCATRRSRSRRGQEEALLFHEFFHGDTGEGLGASHQTGWTGLVALLIHEANRPS